MLGQGVKDFLRVRGANFGVRRILILSSDDTYILAQSMLLSLRRLTCHAMRCNVNTTNQHVEGEEENAKHQADLCADEEDGQKVCNRKVQWVSQIRNSTTTINPES
jgi:hypothetical protein